MAKCWICDKNEAAEVTGKYENQRFLICPECAGLALAAGLEAGDALRAGRLIAWGGAEDMESVVVRAAEYHWDCPNCGHLNVEIEATGHVGCGRCQMEFEAEAEHAEE